MSLVRPGHPESHEKSCSSEVAAGLIMQSSFRDGRVGGFPGLQTPAQRFQSDAEALHRRDGVPQGGRPASITVSCAAAACQGQDGEGRAVPCGPLELRISRSRPACGLHSGPDVRGSTLGSPRGSAHGPVLAAGVWLGPGLRSTLLCLKHRS